MAKDFKTPNNPAMAFISADEEEITQEKTADTAAKKSKTSKGKSKKASAAQETRTRRVQLVLPPTLYEQLNDTAWNQRQSVNETVIKAVQEYIRRHK